REGGKVRDLEKRLAEALAQLQETSRELAESRDQQIATSEILRVISSSPSALQLVFATILRAALRLSGSLMGGIYRFDGELISLACLDGLSPAAAEVHAQSFPCAPQRGLLAARAMLERRVVQMPDAFADVEFEHKAFARAAGWRSSVSVPMLHEGAAIGAISVARKEVGPLPEATVALLQTFADQAVIAVENVRLFTETKEALERQT